MPTSDENDAPEAPRARPPAGEQELAIRVRGVGKRFGPKVVYDGLDLDLRRGETLTLVGGSGSGKSVLLKLLIGLLKPERGSIVVGGVDVVPLDERALREVRRRVAMLFQGSALFDSMSVGENVAYGLREQYRWPEAKVRARVAECLEWVGLPGTQGLDPPALSGGMRKRVALARALAPGAEVILYDEPTTGLDPSNARRINELIRALQSKLGVTSLVITHDVEGAFAVANRIALLRDRRIDLVVDAAEARRTPPPALADFLQGSLGEEASP